MSVAEISKEKPNAQFKAKENKDNWPRGCYMANKHKNQIFFNNHVFGSPRPEARPICNIKAGR